MSDNIYWGDIHGHTQLSTFCFWKQCIPTTPDDYYLYARDVSKLDFCAITDHDTSISDEDWETLKHASKKFNADGRFVTIPGYEWTSWVYGHQNVYHLTEDHTRRMRCSPDKEGWDPEGDSPEQLWEKLRDQGVPFITIPHHVGVTQMPANWDYYNPEAQPVCEITSLWGNFEYYGNESSGRISDVVPGHFVRDALKRGYRFGFVGGGDSHDGRPGASTFAGREKPNILSHQPSYDTNPLGLSPSPVISDEYANWRGLTALYAPSLTRASVFDALLKKRTYATTGARIRLAFDLNGHFMGETCQLTDPEAIVKLSWQIEGTHKIKRILIIRNSEVIHIETPGNTTACNGSFVDLDVTEPVSYYYIRVEQVDGHKAWCSPVWVEWTTRPQLHWEKQTLSQGEEVVRVTNKGLSVARNMQLTVFSESLQELPSGSSSKEHHEHESGTRVDYVPTSRHKGVLTLFFDSEDDSVTTYFGSVSFTGVLDYSVRTIGFEFLKFGGDLYRDFGEGVVEWHVRGGTSMEIALEEAQTEDVQFLITWHRQLADRGPIETGTIAMRVAEYQRQNVMAQVQIAELKPGQHMGIVVPTRDKVDAFIQLGRKGK